MFFSILKSYASEIFRIMKFLFNFSANAHLFIIVGEGNFQFLYANFHTRIKINS